MSDFISGIMFGASTAGSVLALWMTWLSSREHREVIRCLNDHMEWLRGHADELNDNEPEPECAEDWEDDVQ